MAAHKLPRFSKSILDKPQLLHPDKFLEIADILDNRSEYLKLREEAQAANLMDFEGSGANAKDDLVPDNIGVLDIDGPLTARANMFQALCGGASYEALISQTEEFVKQGVDTVLMRISSPGGEAFKMFSSAERIKKLCKDNDIRLVAYVDNQAASAGYGLASVADEIIAHPESSSIGSIGVIISMMDDSKAMNEAGLKRVFVSAGSAKHPFAEDGSFKDTFLGGLQKDVDKLYTKFITHVSTNRGMSEDVVRGTEANTYHAEEALELGLIDKMLEEHELYEYLEMSNPNSQSSSLTSEGATKLYKKETTSMSEAKLEGVEAEMASKLAELQAQFEAKEAEMVSKLAQYEAKELAEKKESLSALVAGIGFSDEGAVVDAMMSSAETETLLSGLVGDFKTKLDTVNVAHQKELNTLKEVADAAELKATEATAKAEATVVEAKEEFSSPVLVEGDNTSLEDTKVDAEKSSKLAEFIKNKHNL